MSSPCIYQSKDGEYESRVYSHAYGYSAFESRRLGFEKTMDRAIALCQRRKSRASPSTKLLITFLLALVAALVLKFRSLLF
jgi:hypothetical protein